MTAAQHDLQAVLKERFGFDSFRPGQASAIEALLARKDVLAIFPTGAGKSLVYQLTAQLLPGLTVVVSPLIALMHDQVAALRERGIGVSVINSTLNASEAKQELEQARSGASKLLYVAPERFNNKRFMRELCAMDVSLFVVDEAHCVSDWGHAFRPSYLGLADAIACLKRRPVVLALTATATPWVRKEIAERLAMRDPHVIVRGTDRPNLFFELHRVEHEDEDRRVLKTLLLDEPANYPDELREQLQTAMQGSGIIYTSTTKAARETADWLRDWGIAAEYYHGQRKPADRERVQAAFMSGEIRVMVATNAFGLGIDKPDVRFVIHRDIPGSIEAYYQEAGRAGRDGDFARCVVIFRSADLGRSAFLSGGGQLTRDEVRQARDGLVQHPEATRKELEQATGLNQGDLARLIAALKSERIVRERRGRIVLLKPDFDPDAVPLDKEAYRLAYERSRVEMMRGYAETDECRRRYLLAYFGEQYEDERCGTCDNDHADAIANRVVITPEQPSQASFPVGSTVIHNAWGSGVVQSASGADVTVLFETVGYKTLAGEVARQQGLLKAAD